MCEASVYLITDTEPRLVMEAVDTVTPQSDGLRLENIFGDQLFLKATIHAVSLDDHTITLRATPGAAGPPPRR